MEDLRELIPEEKMFFIYTIGINKAKHNIKWANNTFKKNLLKSVQIFIATDVSYKYKNNIPLILVSKHDLYKITDPHISEHEWKEISIDELNKF